MGVFAQTVITSEPGPPDKPTEPATYTPCERSTQAYVASVADWVSLALVEPDEPRSRAKAGPSSDSGASGAEGGERVLVGGRRG